MEDQLIIGSKSSYDDFEASVKESFISTPKKKEIKESVPFSNKPYDFSAINGEVYWEERELEYVFEIIAENPEELTQKKTLFLNWVMNVMEEKIYDPYDPDYYYVGTYSDSDCDDDESKEKATITVTFKAYPYKYSNRAMSSRVTVPSRSEQSVNLVNDSAHRIIPTITVDNNIVIISGGTSSAISAGTYTEGVVMLQKGVNTLLLQNNTDLPCNVVISYSEEVF